MNEPPEHPWPVFLQLPEPDGVLQVFSTQHWMLAAPGQWPATEKPPHEEVDMQVPAPLGVEQEVRLKRSAGRAEAREKRANTIVEKYIMYY